MIILKNPKIRKLLEELGLPETTKFCGYVLKVPYTHEYVYPVFEKKRGWVLWKFCEGPENAKKYDNYAKAMREAAEYEKKSLSICYLFDLGTQFRTIEV